MARHAESTGGCLLQRQGSTAWLFYYVDMISVPGRKDPSHNPKCHRRVSVARLSVPLQDGIIPSYAKTWGGRGLLCGLSSLFCGQRPTEHQGANKQSLMDGSH